MKNSFLLSFILLLVSASVFSQEFSGKVLDEKTKKPIPFATVQFAKNRGVITNDEGFFTINRPASEIEELMISSVGYEPNQVKTLDTGNNIFYLKTQVIQLDDVFISDKKLTGKEIMEKAKERVEENYDIGTIKKRFFFRESNLNAVKRFDLDVQESSIADIDQNLMDSISESIPKNVNSYIEALGDFKGNYKSQEVELIKGANLYNPQSTASLDKLLDRMDNLFKENVKPDSYLKIKSGLLGVKVDVDEIIEENEKPENEPTEEEIAETEARKKKSVVETTNTYVESLLNHAFWNEEGTFNLFDKLNKYRFTVEGYTYLESSLVYIIKFEPKGNADFKGQVYVDTEDYGVHRLDYENVKPLKKFKLLGISSIDDVFRGKMIFTKNASGHYLPRYMEREAGESFGIDRPLKMIEKNKNVIGKRKQNELDLDILINVSQRNKYQLIFFYHFDEENAVAIDESSSNEFEYQTLKKYDPDFWDGYNIMEPNSAIKEFTAIESK
ncbi:carboxypeptidase-like regulatory domain-containing protein [Gramella sp. MT6]|uniref:carboxypeptidase-like regulatory domain-containing protein n=1 Tax=Gramella sp. MT6 TaxID=2705471 RepID=UPI001C5FABF6|nr:carboxypeptidase-like regulatory domain-containing protein [Gramella sp. MT6]QYA25267.1 carboxypeptidase-like regulatory domain-containing protein [Gramella sp. MT6]